MWGRRFLALSAARRRKQNAEAPDLYRGSRVRLLSFNRGRHARLLINTGLQAGVRRRLPRKAVSTAFLIFPPQPMSLDELPELVAERAHPMVLFLPSDIRGDLIDI